MNREDLICWATQCKMPYDFVTGEIVQIEKLERFAALVAAAEREACAKVCETHAPTTTPTYVSYAAAIRARGQA